MKFGASDNRNIPTRNAKTVLKLIRKLLKKQGFVRRILTTNDITSRNVTNLDHHCGHMGRKESVKDTARVLGRMYDRIEYWGSRQRIVETLAQYNHVRIFNGLTIEFHPAQMVADLMTTSYSSFPPFVCNQSQNCHDMI